MTQSSKDLVFNEDPFKLGGFLSPMNRIKIVLLSKSGRVIFIDKKTNTTDFNVDIGGREYRVRKEGLYKKDAWLYREVLDRLFKFREYWILFNEGDPDHLIPSNPQVSPYELYMINTSTSIKRALSEYVSGGMFDGKGAFLMIVIGLILAYLILSGGDLSGGLLI